MRSFLLPALAALSLLVAGCDGVLLSGSDEEAADATDSKAFDSWAAGDTNRADVAAFQDFLVDQRVDGIVPLWQLLRSDRKWKKCKQQPFGVPPRQLWPNIVPTLKLVRDEIEPRVGKVEVESSFRDPKINDCVGGAKQSFHMRFYALDLIPVDPSVKREDLITRLCEFHAREGRKLNMGLGIYNARRFHVDRAGFRRWGQDKTSATSPCP